MSRCVDQAKNNDLLTWWNIYIRITHDSPTIWPFTNGIKDSRCAHFCRSIVALATEVNSNSTPQAITFGTWLNSQRMTKVSFFKHQVTGLRQRPSPTGTFPIQYTNSSQLHLKRLATTDKLAIGLFVFKFYLFVSTETQMNFQHGNASLTMELRTTS